MGMTSTAIAATRGERMYKFINDLMNGDAFAWTIVIGIVVVVVGIKVWNKSRAAKQQQEQGKQG